jgi:hypothetical protein
MGSLIIFPAGGPPIRPLLAKGGAIEVIEAGFRITFFAGEP